jgi:uncharacterized metal-binding protein YceD (DUF177 family)
MTQPEFSRPRRLDQIGGGDSTVSIAAEPGERAALAARFGLESIESLAADYALRRDGTRVTATGRLVAAVVQRCVVTAAPVPAHVDEPFALRFVPEGEADSGDDIELSEDDCDVIFYTGGTIDMGEAAAESLALALDPFPRSPEAAEALRDAGVLSEEEAGKFGALAGLRDQLAGK